MGEALVSSMNETLLLDGNLQMGFSSLLTAAWYQNLRRMFAAQVCTPDVSVLILQSNHQNLSAK